MTTLPWAQESGSHLHVAVTLWFSARTGDSWEIRQAISGAGHAMLAGKHFVARAWRGNPARLSLRLLPRLSLRIPYRHSWSR